MQKLSGRRGSNPRPSAWKADALPVELLPPIPLLQKQQKVALPCGGRRIRTSVGRSPADLQSAPFGHSGIPPYFQHPATEQQSWRWDLNPQPPDYKSGALPIELRQQARLHGKRRHRFSSHTCFQTPVAPAACSSTRTPAREASGMYRSAI
jgi:hypothetical protein